MKGLGRLPIKCTLDQYSIMSLSGSLSLYQKNLMYVRWHSGTAIWWNMFSMSAVTAYGWRRKRRRTPLRELLRSGPCSNVSLRHMFCVFAAESKTIRAFPFCQTEKSGIQYALPSLLYRSCRGTGVNRG